MCKWLWAAFLGEHSVSSLICEKTSESLWVPPQKEPCGLGNIVSVNLRLWAKNSDKRLFFFSALRWAVHFVLFCFRCYSACMLVHKLDHACNDWYFSTIPLVLGIRLWLSAESQNRFVLRQGCHGYHCEQTLEMEMNSCVMVGKSSSRSQAPSAKTSLVEVLKKVCDKGVMRKRRLIKMKPRNTWNSMEMPTHTLDFLRRSWFGTNQQVQWQFAIGHVPHADMGSHAKSIVKANVSSNILIALMRLR